MNSRKAALGQVEAVLLDRFAAAGYARVDTPILAPSSIFLDFSGEEIRSALFLTSDGSGAELCLRPEYTIPVCRAYLASALAGQQASYSYCGPVFRSRAGASGERLQSGLESFGRPDIAAADAEILVLTLDAIADAGLTDHTVTMGDAGLLTRLFDVLRLPPHWQRRLRRGLDKGHGLDAIMTNAPTVANDHSGVIAALTGTDQKGARALVEDLLSIAGIATVGGRSASEIAERFLGQVANRTTPSFGEEQRGILETFLGLRGNPDDASAALRRLASDARLDLGAVLDLFDERANFVAVHGVPIEAIDFRAAFGRNLDYYTGFVFEVRHAADRHAPGAPDDVVSGGGRYDRLAQSLGSREAIPAVGAAIWVDRLTAGAVR